MVGHIICQLVEKSIFKTWGSDVLYWQEDLVPILKSVVQITKMFGRYQQSTFSYYLCKCLKNLIIIIVFSVGYKKEMVIDYMQSVQRNFPVKLNLPWKRSLWVPEAILNALPFTGTEDVFIVNGDTFFDVNLDKLYAFRKSQYG